MKVNEIFRSLQGESSYSGLPCIFVRLTGCNLKCSYCDTKYAYEEGTEMSITEVYEMIKSFAKDGDILEITGGEPLLQSDEVNELIKRIRTKIKRRRIGDILIETNGSVDIGLIKDRWVCDIKIIMDWKSPSSDMSKKMLESNLKKIKREDELKFVLENSGDYEEMKRILNKYKLKCEILISTIWNNDFNKDIRKYVAERMLEDGIKARFQIQLHKIIWDKDKRGV